MVLSSPRRCDNSCGSGVNPRADGAAETHTLDGRGSTDQDRFAHSRWLYIVSCSDIVCTVENLRCLLAWTAWRVKRAVEMATSGDQTTWGWPSDIGGGANEIALSRNREL
jgi:hypothetical protein